MRSLLCCYPPTFVCTESTRHSPPQSRSVRPRSLCRIRSNWVPTHFEKFEIGNQRFLPKEKLAYEYPEDFLSSNNDDAITTAATDAVAEGGDDAEKTKGSTGSKRDDIAMEMTGAIRLLAARSIHHLLGGDSGPTQALPVQILKDRLMMLAKGDLLSQEDRMKEHAPSITEVTVMHLKHLLSLSLELSEMLWQRRVAVQNKDRVHYQVGDIVQHKKYGFRGVVVAWDPYPSVDVSRWDGLTEIDQPEQYPFYHVVPDEDDAIAAFGGERPLRYVCEANMQPCPPSDTKLNVDLEPEWVYDPTNGRYIAPDELKVRNTAESRGYRRYVLWPFLELVPAATNVLSLLYLSSMFSHPPTHPLIHPLFC